MRRIHFQFYLLNITPKIEMKCTDFLGGLRIVHITVTRYALGRLELSIWHVSLYNKKTEISNVSGFM